jgi:hypothetical protein
MSTTITQLFVVVYSSAIINCIVGALLFLWLQLLLELTYFLLCVIGVLNSIKKAKLVLLLE